MYHLEICAFATLEKGMMDMKQIKMLGKDQYCEMQDPELLKRQLQQLVELWHQRITADADCWFQEADIQRMHRPVIFFHEAMNWLSNTTVINTRWFLNSGSDYIKARWLQDDHNVY